MATLSAKRIQQNLDKAKNLGLVEESFELVGHTIVVQNLTPTAYEVVLQEFEDKEDQEAINAWRIEHLAHAIVEIDGVDLRDCKLIEVEVEEQDESGGIRTITVKVEKHAYLRDYLLSTWKIEALRVAYRKFEDAVAKGEEQASKGVVFHLPEETADAKYRRLLSEIRALEPELPAGLSDQLLEEHGYLNRTSDEELKAAAGRIRRIEEPASAPLDPPPRSVVPPEPPRALTSEEKMRSRQPLNQRPSDSIPQAYVPMVPEAAPVVAAHPAPPPVQEVVSPKTAAYAALEALEGPSSEPEVLQPVLRPDPAKAAQSMDSPPLGGVNRRFRPPPRTLLGPRLVATRAPPGKGSGCS